MKDCFIRCFNGWYHCNGNLMVSKTVVENFMLLKHVLKASLLVYGITGLKMML